MTLHMIPGSSAGLANVRMEQRETVLPEAPAFQLKDLDGATWNLESFRGSYLVVHFATTWCPFCNAEAPHLEQLNADYIDQPVQVLIIDVKEDGDLVRTRLKDRFNLSFPILLDPDGFVAASYAPKNVRPDLARDEVMLASNLIIDPDGHIRFLSLLDTTNFDARLVALRTKLNELLASN